MRYVDLGEHYQFRYAFFWGAGPDLDHAVDRGLIGITQQNNPGQPTPAAYVRGPLMHWLLDNLGESSEGQWRLANRNVRYGVELSFVSKQQAMQFKLIFSGTPVLIP